VAEAFFDDLEVRAASQEPGGVGAADVVDVEIRLRNQFAGTPSGLVAGVLGAYMLSAIRYRS
jgi:hypothetical protein